jgi:hypothetical protein
LQQKTHGFAGRVAALQRPRRHAVEMSGVADHLKTGLARKTS